MTDEFREKNYRIMAAAGSAPLAVLVNMLIGIPGVKFVDFELPVVDLKIDVDPVQFQDSEAIGLLRRMGFRIETRGDEAI